MPELSSEIEPLPPTDRLRWSFAACAAATTIVVFAIIQISSAWDFLGFFYVILIVPALSLGIVIAAIIYAARRRPRTSISILLALIVYDSLSWLLLKNSSELHGRMLWAVHSKEYKAEVLAQRPEGALNHMEWFGWGFAGSDTTMYLAYDPNNSLAHKDPATGRYGPLHCDVWGVHRLEDNWYSVTFYTNTGWESTCDTATPDPGS